MHTLAVGYSPACLTENADGIRSDWPHIPLPAEKNTLQTSAELGQRISGLLNAEHAVSGVTTGKLAAPLPAVAAISRVGGGPLPVLKMENSTLMWAVGARKQERDCDAG